MSALFGIANLVAAYVFASQGSMEAALFCFTAGLVFSFVGWRGLWRQERDSLEFTKATDRIDEALSLWQGGEGPDGIANKFHERYKVRPIITLQMLASRILKNIGRSFHADFTKDWIAWLSSGRKAPLPPPKQAITQLDLGRDLHCMIDGMRFYSRTGWLTRPARGWIVATRDYFIFLPYETWESLAEGSVKEFLMSFLPSSIGLQNTIRDTIEALDNELKLENRDRLSAEILSRLDLPDTLVIPWRDIRRAWKKSEDGWILPRTYLMIAHGDAANPITRRLSRGNGYGEASVDEWIENIRVACVLEGVLLEV